MIRNKAAVRAQRRRRVILGAAVLLVPAALLAFFGFIVYQIKFPDPVPEDVGPSHYLLKFEEVAWTSPDGSEVTGWWIPGRAGAPAVVLAPGFGLSRSDGLSLAAALRKRGFHSLIYAAAGRSGEGATGASAIGRRATERMLSALDVVKSKAGVDSARTGIWGVDVGAHAAFETALERKEVRAIAADSPFDATGDFLRLRLESELGRTGSWIEYGCRQMVGWMEGMKRADFDEPLPLEALADRAVLVIKGENRGSMGQKAVEIFSRLRGEKELIELNRSRERLMSAESASAYDREVADFFSRSLSAGRPLSAQQPGPASGNRNE